MYWLLRWVDAREFKSKQDVAPVVDDTLSATAQSSAHDAVGSVQEADGFESVQSVLDSIVSSAIGEEESVASSCSISGNGQQMSDSAQNAQSSNVIPDPHCQPVLADTGLIKRLDIIDETESPVQTL